MYLLVFVTLMISIIGLYTQVLGLQASRLAANQDALGAAMLQWHAAAISEAASIIKTNAAAYTPAIQASGCRLIDYQIPNSTLATCPPPNFYGPATYTAAITQGTITYGGATPVLSLMAQQGTATTNGTNPCVHLPSRCTNTLTYINTPHPVTNFVCTPPSGPAATNCGCQTTKCSPSYDIKNHQFYSILYQDQTTQQNLVVTFVPAPVVSTSNPPPGFVTLVDTQGTGGLLTGLTISDLARQVSNAGAPNYTFGYFKGFPNAPVLAVSGNTYNLPSTGVFKSLCNGSTSCAANGSLAVIGSPDGF